MFLNYASSMPLITTAFCLLTTSCQQQQQDFSTLRSPVYRYIPGKTAILQNGKAIAPAYAPTRVKRAIAAANKIVGKPYRMGGGHGKHHDTGYDCSGSTAFVLKEARLLDPKRYPVSGDFKKWGRPGFGDWITVYTKNGHVFLMIAGLRFDTTGSAPGVGPRWYTKSRGTRGFVVRHIPGL